MNNRGVLYRHPECTETGDAVGCASRRRLRCQHDAGSDLHRAAYKNAGDAAALSGMAQSVGYLMAAMGPLLPGKVQELCGGWTLPLLMAAAIAVVGACTGIAAGRNAHLEPVQQPY